MQSREKHFLAVALIGETVLTCTWARGADKPARHDTMHSAQELQKGNPVAVLEQRRASVSRVGTNTNVENQFPVQIPEI